ncbi:MAG TPA: hypothetical protein VNE67_08015 [Acetobacteraceae bacterium]|nr:hypothetical protein [Acetobacteraceae bacterium]
MAGDPQQRDWVRRVLGVSVPEPGRLPPRSVLPEAPPVLTRQGRAMANAAARGAMFCEACPLPSGRATEAAGVG